MTKKEQIIRLLKQNTPPHQVAALIHCAVSYVHAINRGLGIRHFTKGKTSTARPPTHATQRHCTRCTFIEELPLNPIDKTGICLYCRLLERGVNLLDYHESGEWMRYLKEYNDERIPISP